MRCHAKVFRFSFNFVGLNTRLGAPAFLTPGGPVPNFESQRYTTMAKMRMNELRTILARANAIVEEYDTNRAAELAAAGDDAGNVGEAKEIEKKDQPGAQDRAIDPAAARAYRELNSIPGYSRIRTGTPVENQDRFFKKS